MKKILVAVLFFMTATISNICSANSYDDSPDYIVVNSGHGATEYLALKSVVVEEDNPPYYQIEGVIVVIYTSGGQSTIYECIRYNWDTKETYSWINRSWQKNNILRDGTGSRREQLELRRKKNAVNALFRVAYGRNFYDD